MLCVDYMHPIPGKDAHNTCIYVYMYIFLNMYIYHVVLITCSVILLGKGRHENENKCIQYIKIFDKATY